MDKEMKCRYVCSLRTLTLISLWIVVNITINDLASKTRQIVGNGISAIKENTPNNDAKTVKQQGTITFPDIGQIGDALKDTVDKVKQIPGEVVDKASKIPENLAGDIINKVVQRSGIEEFIDKFIKDFFRYFIRVCIILAVICSSIGIFGIYRNFPKCLILSIIFFYLFIVAEVIVMLEINVDPSIERKMFVLSELTRIDWISSLDSMMVINSGFLIFIALSVFVLGVVTKYRSAMLKKDGIKKIETILLEHGVPPKETENHAKN